MKVTAPYRGRSSSRRLDLTDMKHALGVDGFKMWCALAIVQAPQGESHFEVLADDVHVEVVTQPSLIPLTCRLTAGMWRIPDIGEEVVVLIPEGEIAFMPILIDVLSSGSVPTTQGPALSTDVIVRPHVLVHDGTGGAEPLVPLSQFNAFRAWVEQQFSSVGGHTHAVAGAATTNTTTVTVTGTAAPTVAVPSVAGTTVLEAK